MSKNTVLAQMYREVLHDRMGLDVTLCRRSIAVDLAEGLHAQVVMYDNDPGYLQLVATFEGSEIEVSREELAAICARVTQKMKVAKAFVDSDGDLLFSIEMLVAASGCLPTADHLASVLPRAAGILVESINAALTEIRFARITDELSTGSTSDSDAP
jgi:hypothetical protein